MSQSVDCALATPEDGQSSIAVKAGVPIGVISERLGHGAPEFTLRYSNVMSAMQRRQPDTIAMAVRWDAAA